MTLVIGTARGTFVAEGAGPAKLAADTEERSVRYLGREAGQLWAGTDGGLFRSGDGRAWTPAGLEGRFVWDLAPSPADPRALWAVTQPVGLFASRDGGGSWTEQAALTAAPGADRWCLPVTPPTPPRARSVAFDRGTPGRAWIAVEVGGVAITEDGGRSWRVAEPGGNPDPHVIVAHPARPATIFTSMGLGRMDGHEPMEQRIGGVFRSDDGGASWRYCWGGMRPRYTRPLCIDPRPPHALTVTSSPTAFSSAKDPGGARAVVYQSLDLGESWRSLGDAAHAPSAAQFHAVTPDPERVGGVLVGTDTGEVWRVGPDATWRLLAEGLPSVQAILPL